MGERGYCYTNVILGLRKTAATGMYIITIIIVVFVVSVVIVIIMGLSVKLQNPIVFLFAVCVLLGAKQKSSIEFLPFVIIQPLPLQSVAAHRTTW